MEPRAAGGCPRTAPGAGPAPCLPPGRTPSVATLHRLFKTLDVAAFEHALGRWVQRTSVHLGEAFAIDGKTLRGAARGTLPGVPGAHLVAAYAHEAQLIVAQVASAGKGHELAAIQRVLTSLPLAGRVVTADALATQRAVCEQVVDAKGAYLLPVKENQPALLEDCQAAFSPVARDRAGWDGMGVPTAPTWYRQELATRGGVLRHVAQREPKARHGRHETRLLWALADPQVNAHLGECGDHERPWPHVAQVCLIERRRGLRRGGHIVEEAVEVSYAVTSLPPERADAARLLRVLRGHWGIENRMQWVRDVTFDEDRSPVRAGAAPQAMAALRNLALALLRRARCWALHAMRRTLAGRPHQAVQLVLSGRLC